MADDVVLIGDEPGLKSAASDAVTIDEKADGAKLPRQASLNSDGSVTLTLMQPVSLKWRPASGGEVQEERYAQLIMKRLKGADMIKIMDADRADMAVVSIACSVGMNAPRFRHIFERMDAVDIAAASQVVSYFLQSGPTTGG